MTTKLLLHSINSLTRAPHNFLAVSPSSIHRCCMSPMDRILELQSMRRTMLMQEETFKQQVQELHRLYDLQKRLMHELEKGLKRPTQPQEAGHRDDQKELSSSCSGEICSRMPIMFDLDRPSESTPSTIHHRKDLRKIDEEETDAEVELTLSIGHATRTQRSKELGSSATTRTNKGGDQSSVISSSSVYQENVQPHWLLDDLSLNRT